MGCTSQKKEKLLLSIFFTSPQVIVSSREVEVSRAAERRAEVIPIVSSEFLIQNPITTYHFPQSANISSILLPIIDHIIFCNMPVKW